MHRTVISNIPRTYPMFSRFAMAMRWNDTVNMKEMAQVFVDAYVTREGFRPAVEIALEVANISDHVVLNLDINCNPRHRVLFLLHMYRSQYSRRGPTWELPSITSSTFSSRYCTTLPMLQHCSSLYMYTACSLKRTGSPTWEPGSTVGDEIFRGLFKRSYQVRILLFTSPC